MLWARSCIASCSASDTPLPRACVWPAVSAPSTAKRVLAGRVLVPVSLPAFVWSLPVYGVTCEATSGLKRPVTLTNVATLAP